MNQMLDYKAMSIDAQFQGEFENTKIDPRKPGGIEKNAKNSFFKILESLPGNHAGHAQILKIRKKLKNSEKTRKS